MSSHINAAHEWSDCGDHDLTCVLISTQLRRIPGKPLRDVLHDPLARTSALAAVTAVHGQGVRHGDLNMRNVVYDAGAYTRCCWATFLRRKVL